MRPDIAERLHQMMLRSGWQSRDDQETLLDAMKEIEGLRIFKQAVLDPENQPSQFGTKLID